MTSKIVVNNIEADAGISTVAFNDQIRVGSATTIHSTGIDLGSGNINSHNINSSGIVTAIGLDINGNGDISGNLNVAGVLTYEDVTSVDAVGLSTFQAGIHVTGGSVGIGTAVPNEELHIHASGTSYIRFTDETSGSNIAERLRITSDGHVIPASNNVYDLGSVTNGWRNIYSNDLNLSNMDGDSNDIDGTNGSWTIQEGKDDLFIINRLTGKKYKINLTEVS